MREIHKNQLSNLFENLIFFSHQSGVWEEFTSIVEISPIRIFFAMYPFMQMLYEILWIWIMDDKEEKINSILKYGLGRWFFIHPLRQGFN